MGQAVWRMWHRIRRNQARYRPQPAACRDGFFSQKHSAGIQWRGVLGCGAPARKTKNGQPATPQDGMNEGNARADVAAKAAARAHDAPPQVLSRFRQHVE